MKNYLPLGSIVRLKGGSKKMMIYGRAQKAGANGKMYDYLACLYPQGFIKANMLLCFNEDQIEEVLFTGYSDEEEPQFVERLNALVESLAQAAETEPEKAEKTDGEA